MHYQLGLSAPNPDTRNFSRKVSWNFKSFRKNKLVCSVRKFLRIFKGLFRGKPLKARFGTQFQHITKKQKTRCKPRFFMCIKCWGVCPKTRHKKLFEKSFLELQKLCSNKRVFLSKVLWLTFLRGKGKLYSVFFKL